MSRAYLRRFVKIGITGYFIVWALYMAIIHSRIRMHSTDIHGMDMRERHAVNATASDRVNTMNTNNSSSNASLTHTETTSMETTNKSSVGEKIDELKRNKTSPKGLSKDFMKFISNASETALQDPLLHKHKYRFILNNEHACRGEVFLLVVIHSGTADWVERNVTRKTWGQVRLHAGAPIVLLFMIAQPGNDANRTQTELVKESETHRDIIQGNFVDSYRNLTYKHVMVLHWIQEHCKHTKFILKSDNDVIVDMYHLIDYIININKSTNVDPKDFLYCSVFTNGNPHRGKNKWLVTNEEYPYARYPPYCEGFAYVMSYDVSRALYQASTRVPFFWIDDIYVTGFLAAHAHVAHKKFEDNHGYTVMDPKTLIVKRPIFLIARDIGQLKYWDAIWKDILKLHHMEN